MSQTVKLPTGQPYGFTAVESRGHVVGSSACPACPTHEDWMRNHCYACGGVMVTPAPVPSDPIWADSTTWPYSRDLAVNPDAVHEACFG